MLTTIALAATLAQDAPAPRHWRIVTSDGKPVASARVCGPAYFDPDFRFVGADALARFVAALPTVATSDEHGAVAQPSIDEGSCWVIESSAGAAHVHVDRDTPSELEVVVAPPRPLRARAVDVDGTPLPGVGLALHYPETNEHWFGDWVVRTGRDGIAEWPGAEVAFLPGKWMGDLEIVAAVPTRGWPAVALDRAVLPIEPPTLVTGRMGRLEMEIRDERGALVPVDDCVWVWFLGDETNEAEEGRRFDERCGSGGWPWRCQFVDGRCRMSEVGVGLRVRVNSGREPRLIGAFDGPHVEGESIGGVVHIGPEEQNAGMRTLCGWALSADRQPFSSRRLHRWEFSDVRGRARWKTESADDALGGDGRFVFMASISEELPEAPTFFFSIVSDEHGSDGIARVKWLDDPSPRRELGDLVFTEAPLVAAGSVSDAGGKPIAGARLWCEPVGSPVFDRWSDDPLPIASCIGRSDLQGRFTIRGIADCRRVRLWIDASGFAGPASQVIGVGASGLEQTLALGGTIRGRLLEEGRPVVGAGILAIHATSPRNDLQEGIHRCCETDGDGRFEIRDVPSGEIEVWFENRLYLRGCVGTFPLVDPAHVVVRAGEVTDVGTVLVPAASGR